MTDLIWGWSTGGHKSHAWRYRRDSTLSPGHKYGDRLVWESLCQLKRLGAHHLTLWTTEKTPGDERTRCRKCTKLVAKE